MDVFAAPIVVTVWSILGVSVTADGNATDADVTICPCVEQIKCATTTLTDIIFFVVNLLAISFSVPSLYSWYRKSDCKFHLLRWSRDENNAREIEDISIDIRLEKCDDTSL